MRPRPAWIEIDRAALRRNVERIRARLAGGARYLAVVKANAYGHGDTICGPAALDGGAAWLGVILVDEGIRLRAAGVSAPILLLHEPPAERAADVIAHDLTPVVFTPRGLDGLASAAERAGTTLRVHLKVDTGLNRLGLPEAHVDDFAARLARAPRIEVEGVLSHLAFADEPGNPFIDEQLSRFLDVLDRLKRLGVEPGIRHLANSAATLTRPDMHFDMVRVGIATYGIAPGPAVAGVEDLEPVLSLRAEVARVKRVRAGEGVSYGLRYRLERDGTIATLPLGYADGWPRRLSSNASVLIGGRRYPAVGTVCMDSFAVDVGDAPVEVGDEVTLIGAQGGERIAAEELAEALGTIAYEVTTQLSSRLPRIARG